MFKSPYFPFAHARKSSWLNFVAAKMFGRHVSVVVLLLGAINLSNAQSPGNFLTNTNFGMPVLATGIFLIGDPPTTSGQPWVFSGLSGVANDLGSPCCSYSVSNPSYAGQYAYIQLADGEYGSISQTVTFTSPGTYAISFFAAGRVAYPAGSGGDLNYTVKVAPYAGGSNVLNVTNTSASSQPFTEITYQFPVSTPGNYIVSLASLSGYGPYTDNTVIINDISLANIALAPSNGAQPVTMISAGVDHSLFLRGDSSLWAMGDDLDGDLGDGTNAIIGSDGYGYFPFGTNGPEEIVASNVIAIAAGASHSLFLKSDGSLWAMGDNTYGELGDGTYNNTNLPEMIVSSGVTAIAAGKDENYPFSLFLKSDGSLWGMGCNNEGQLGIGKSLFSTNLPQQIVPGGVTAIAAGWDHSLFIKNDSSLWGMGINAWGQLGVSNVDSTFGYFGNFIAQPQQIVPSGVTAIAAGSEDSVFLENDASLWGMGDNTFGQLGLTNNNSIFYSNVNYLELSSFFNLPQKIVPGGVTAIAEDISDTLFLESDGGLWGLGGSTDGQLGDGPYNQTNQPELIVPSGVLAISAGYQDTLFIRNDGSLWGMGDNANGQLGLNINGEEGNSGSSYPQRPVQIITAPQISIQLLTGGLVQLSYPGIVGTNFALDLSFTLNPANWVPQVTNVAGAGGMLVFTTTPNPTTNNFWRIRSVP